ncbi:hypothetical protein QCE63_10325 [Caballeronia sp. LZ065]|nr:hypothetical protein [Caballeronia sp. LZ065]
MTNLKPNLEHSAVTQQYRDRMCRSRIGPTGSVHRSVGRACYESRNAVAPLNRQVVQRVRAKRSRRERHGQSGRAAS